MMGNPVMFVVEIGSVITTVLLMLRPHGAFSVSICRSHLWLWFTVLFANFAEAMAEGRGKAQADTLRRARSETIAKRIQSNGRPRRYPARNCAPGTWLPSPLASLLPAMGRLSRAWHRWTSLQSPASRRR